MKKTKKLVLSAIFSAVGVILLLLGSVIDLLDISCAVLASLIPLFLIVEVGTSYAVSVYAAISVLSLFLLPTKTPAFLFAAMFGYLPILKCLFERMGKVWSLLCRFLIFNAVLVLVGFFEMNIVGLHLENQLGLPKWVMIAFYFVLSNCLLFLCDVVYGRLLRIYLSRYRDRIRKYLK